VPQVAVTRTASGQATALVVGPDGKVSVRPIVASRTSGSDWVVEGGLDDGEKVIVAGVQKARPGATVKIVEGPAGLPAPVASN